ncbi:LysR family transcriptional regulator [Amnibacterium sp. CER49]|uniref:LysR family transcriptional regulator n=1 Tax=Amnibacterium sp. CER49 TaxID=3039161 RepID=UPI002449A194|nr:LysR family transcriptional regulator [Amnibacterium sp. CER49]MDH2443611.1 LysR family transcriptional regulator [Amnibacterium sp. CER49]
MYEVRRLRLLRELALRGTLAEVAAALSYSPSSVSQQLSLLEREVGVPLLQPAGRGVVLTPEAELLVERTGAVLDLLERTESELQARSARVTGAVRLAIFQSASLALLPATLTRMRRAHPDVRVEAVQNEPERALKQTSIRDFDLVVAEQYPGHATVWHEGLDRRHLLTDRLRLAVAPGSDAAALADAAGLPWVMEPHGTASRHFSEQVCRSAGFEPDVQYETADLQLHIRLIESGNAVAIMPDLVWAGRPTSVRLLDLPGDPRRTIFTAARASTADRPALAALRQALEVSAADLHG